MSRTMGKGPRFVRFFGPVIEALKSLGGSGSPEEVRAAVAARLAISEKELEEQLPSGSSRFDNQVAWARFYLSRANLLDSSRRGIWSLTEKGRAIALSDDAALDLFKNVHKRFTAERRASKERAEEPTDQSEFPTAGAPNHREALLLLLRSLPAPGFERLCQRLLRESGFQQVAVTGRSGERRARREWGSGSQSFR